MARMTYLQAISDALRTEMRRDPNVFLIGEDIAVFGGAFKITQGFLQEFGEDRVIDTPISESGFVGAACAAATVGFRPVVEFQFIDFISCAFDQIVNYAAKCYYRWGIQMPVVLRGPTGGGVHAGPFHSQNPEAWFAHTPGLKVVLPSTARDAKGLLTAAIRDNNPVIYLENKFLYRHYREDVPEGEHVTPIGVAALRTVGDDLSIISYGATVHHCVEAARMLEKEGASVEVLDLRSLVPLDRKAILESVRKTSRALVVHEANLTAGFGGEVAALIAQEAFEYLDAPVTRVASLDVPVPFSPPLEMAMLPSVDKIANAARSVLAY
ncbi:MAG: alpha-ketoacid dehydrogenase subunit beta [Blastocatellia bacterium AA13]|nr:MAG: alpha-ketoacid dehydrogenase subunit beta [Blastocatellia bacterium AA13]